MVNKNVESQSFSLKCVFRGKGLLFLIPYEYSILAVFKTLVYLRNGALGGPCLWGLYNQRKLVILECNQSSFAY